MKNLLFFCFALLVSGTAFAQTTPVKIVFDVTSSDKSVHESAIRHIKLMSDLYPASEFEMVLYSGSLPMVLKDESTVSKDLEMLAARENVSFKVCEMTMKRHEKTMANLIPGVGIVPDGILEIIMKQKEGWGYIKESK